MRAAFHNQYLSLPLMTHVRWKVLNRKLLITPYAPSTCCSLPLVTKHFHGQRVLRFSPYVFSAMDHVSNPMSPLFLLIMNMIIIIVIIIIIIFLRNYLDIFLFLFFVSSLLSFVICVIVFCCFCYWLLYQLINVIIL